MQKSKKGMGSSVFYQVVFPNLNILLEFSFPINIFKIKTIVLNILDIILFRCL